MLLTQWVHYNSSSRFDYESDMILNPASISLLTAFYALLLLLFVVALGVFLIFKGKKVTPVTSPEEVLPRYEKAEEGQLPPAYDTPTTQSMSSTVTAL
jgi:hypothetical protein